LLAIPGIDAVLFAARKVDSHQAKVP